MPDARRADAQRGGSDRQTYAFEKAVTKAAGGDGFADVWKKDFFGWEYKGKGKDLKAAYLQLLGYREDLSNPPLLVVSDLDTIEIRTNFTNLSPKLYTVTLDDLAADDPSEALATLRAVFTAPEELRPRIETRPDHREGRAHFAELAQSLQARGHDPEDVAHFLDRILFMLFAEDAGLLPKNILPRLSQASHGKSDVFSNALGDLFSKMSEHGGLFGTEEIDWFNGGLFDTGDVIPLTGTEITTLLEVSKLNWALIEPAIFGTLFERGLDPEQRAQLGAHYTDRDAIWGLVEPVILRPLRREYAEMQTTCRELLLSGKKVTKATRPEENPQAVFRAFLDRLRRVRVLDPACGSGNFLIVSLWALKDLEWEAIQWGSLVLQTPQEFPHIGPEAVLGIELNAYAAELARVTIWIGEIQWMIRHGLGYRRDPILKSLNHIENRDALLDLTDPSKPQEARWPEAEFIVGNPPFLGAKLLRRGLGDDYVEALFDVFGDRLPGMSDLSSYFHEKARAQIEPAGRTRRRASSRLKGSAAARIGASLNASSSPATSSSPDRTSRGCCPARTSTSASSARTMGPRPSASSTGHGHRRSSANLTTGLDLHEARRLPRTRHRLSWASQKGGPVRDHRRTRCARCSQPEPRWSLKRDVVRPWVNGGHHRSNAPHVDHRLRRRHVGGRGGAVRGAVRVRTTHVVKHCASVGRDLIAIRGGFTWDRDPGCGRPSRASPIHRDARDSQTPPLRLGRVRRLPDPARRSIRATTTTRSVSCTRGPTSSGRAPPARSSAKSSPASATRRRPPSRPSRSRTHRRAARESRGGRPPPRRAARRLAQPARPRSRRPREADPHQPLQPAPHLARPRPRHPRRRRLRRLRLARPRCWSRAQARDGFTPAEIGWLEGRFFDLLSTRRRNGEERATAG